MQSGDIVSDSQGGSWVVDAHLGRGLWGSTWSLRAESGDLAVVKIPHGRADVGGSDDLAAACLAAAHAAQATLESRKPPYAPRLLSTLTLADGRTGLVMPRYEASLEARLAGGVSLSQALDLVVRVLHRISTSTSAGAVHGNLRPSNIFVDDSGDPVLADALPAPIHAHRKALERLCTARASYLPPEAEARPSGIWDTWALCLALFRAASNPGERDGDGARVLDLPRTGLGRVQLASVKDAAAARLRAERANARFATRATSKLGAVLNRGLSAETDPSPPFRFARAADLLERLVEVDDLVHPAVDTVSKVLLGTEARDGVFDQGDEVQFSVNVGATAGVTAQEDLAVGVQLRDLDQPGDARVRIEGSRFAVDRYPSGKWRFEFVLPDVPPGRYQVRVAFAVKGSDGDPQVAEGQFEVRPRPGYVPAPVEEAPPEPIPFQRPAAGPPPAGSDRNQAVRPPRPIRPPDDELPRPGPVPPFVDAGPATAPTRTDALPRPQPVTPSPNLPPRAPAAPAPLSPGLQAAPPATSPGVPEPPSSPTIPAPVSDATAPRMDPLLHDYPPPAPTGSDLPSYDRGGGAADGGRGAPGAALDRLLAMFQGDPLSAGLAVAAGGVLVLVLAASLLRGCA